MPASNILRAFRVGRVLRLTRYVVSLRIMINTLAKALPGLVNVSALLALLIFMFACLGVGLFGTVAVGPATSGGANFHSFGNALVLLFRGATGERWHLVMHDLAARQPGCTDIDQTPQELAVEGARGCGSVIAYPFFIAYELLVSS